MAGAQLSFSSCITFGRSQVFFFFFYLSGLLFIAFQLLSRFNSCDAFTLVGVQHQGTVS